MKQAYRKDVPENMRLTRTDVGEGSISVTNWGRLYRELRGSCTVAPVIPPCVLCTAIGSIQKQQYVYKNAEGGVDIGEKMILPMTLLFDHRIGGFGDLLPYVKRMDEIFAAPAVIREW